MCVIDYCSTLHEITSDSVFWKVDNIVAILTIQLSQLLSSYIDLCSTALDHVMSHYLPIGTAHFNIKFRLNDPNLDPQYSLTILTAQRHKGW